MLSFSLHHKQLGQTLSHYLKDRGGEQSRTPTILGKYSLCFKQTNTLVAFKNQHTFKN